MIKKKLNPIIPLLVAIFLAAPALSQELASRPDLEQKVYTPTTAAKGAFLGSIIFPGFNVGLERPYKYTRVDKIKTNRTKTLYKERYLNYTLGMYHQNSYHTNLLLQTEWVGRRQKSKGFYYEASFGAGLSRTFVDGATFTVSEENGQIEQVPLSGNWYALTSIGGSLGYNANLTEQRPYSIYLKHQWLFLFPYNAFVTPRPTIALGLNYNLSGFWEATAKYKHKVKERRKVSKTQE